MRIITGKARGKRLLTLEGRDVRPTTERIKESLFNIIQFDIEGRRFLDLFAGSGQVGLEAVSRGGEMRRPGRQRKGIYLCDSAEREKHGVGGISAGGTQRL